MLERIAGQVYESSALGFEIAGVQRLTRTKRLSLRFELGAEQFVSVSSKSRRRSP